MDSKLSRYFFIEFEDGEIEGYEDPSEKVSREDVEKHMMDQWHLKVKATPCKKSELYFSEVDIW